MSHGFSIPLLATINGAHTGTAEDTTIQTCYRGNCEITVITLTANTSTVVCKLIDENKTTCNKDSKTPMKCPYAVSETQRRKFSGDTNPPPLLSFARRRTPVATAPTI